MHETIRSHKRSDLEWMDLIHECRTSGLGDKEWCELNQIPISTFYTKITKLRRKACDIPKAIQRTIGHSQQVVPLSILDESPIPFADATPIQTDVPAVILKLNDYSVTILQVFKSFLVKRETGFENYPLDKILIERDFPAHPIFTYSSGYSKTKIP